MCHLKPRARSVNGMLFAWLTAPIAFLMQVLNQDYHQRMFADCNVCSCLHCITIYLKQFGSLPSVLLSSKLVLTACRGVQTAEDAHLWWQGWRRNDEEHAQEPAEGHGWHEPSQHANEHGSDESNASAPCIEADGWPRGASRAHASNGGHEITKSQTF